MPQSPPTLPALLTPAEAADILRVDPSTLREWVRRDKLECVVLPGGHRRYRRADIEHLTGIRHSLPVSDDLLPHWEAS